jgi:hypothetical protein
MRNRPKPYFIFGNEKEKKMVTTEKGRARFEMRYKNGGLGFNNADSELMAKAYSDLIFNNIKKLFLSQKDAQGKKRKSKISLAKREVVREVQDYLLTEKIEKPKKPPKRKYKTTKSYEKAIASYNKKIEKWKKTKARAKKMKKHNRHRGKVWNPENKNKDAIIWTGLMFSSMKMNKPTVSRRRKDPETGEWYSTKGRARLTVSNKRKEAAHFNRFFYFNHKSPIFREVRSVQKYLHKRAITRWNYNQKRKLLKFSINAFLKFIQLISS